MKRHPVCRRCILKTTCGNLPNYCLWVNYTAIASVIVFVGFLAFTGVPQADYAPTEPREDALNGRPEGSAPGILPIGDTPPEGVVPQNAERESL